MASASTGLEGALMEAAEGAPAEAPATGGSLEELKVQIMADIEARLLQKEESLWKRGQVEIRRLQQEQQQVTANLGKLQERQATLLTESQQLKGAVMDIASKFELVVKQMHEVIRVHHRQVVLRSAAAQGIPGGHIPSPTPSVASTAASEAGKEETQTLSEPTPGTSITAAAALSTPGRELWSTERNRLQSLVLGEPPSVPYNRGFDAFEDPATFLTPPRAALGSSSATGGAVVEDRREPPGSGPGAVLPPLLPASWRGHVLSLADAISAPAPAASASAAVQASPGLKRLHLAECLDQDALLVPSASGTRHTEQPICSVPTGLHTLYIHLDLVKEPGFVTLGIEVNQIDSSSLRVEHIDDHGLVGMHNLRQDSDATRVLLSDRIVEVNGVRRDPTRMLNECKDHRKLALTIARDRPTEVQGGTPVSVAVAGSVGSSEGVAAAAPPTPPRWHLRPEAEVFVPSSQKELSAAGTPAAVASLPPGLAPPEGLRSGTPAAGPSSGAFEGVSSPQPRLEGPLGLADRGPALDEGEALVKRLFH